MIYFSFIGNHDLVSPSSKEHGAFFNIYKNYKSSIEKVFVFVSGSNSNVDYNKIAKQNIELIRQINNDVKINIIEIDFPNPVDYDLVYPAMLDHLLNIIDEHKLQKEKKIINITSGTPTMSACWMLLAKSSLIKNAKLVQSSEKKYAQDGQTVHEVNFEIDDFPKIVAPDAMKRKLTILSRANKELKKQLNIEKLNKEVSNLIGSSRQILEIKDQILNDIDSKTHVLILGERGTGKEVVANAIWNKYHNPKDEKLTIIDCSTISTELAASELFGHVKGAFTGASEEKKGLLEEYKDKIIFLDEIGNLSLEAQANLLRVLTHGEYRKVGSTKVSKINIQIIAATNKNVDDETIFAQDIKDRFDEIIFLPSLKERKDDIPLLVQHFLDFHTKAQHIPSPVQLDSKIINTMINYSWPGNIRDLEKFIRRLLRRFNIGGKISYTDLPSKFISSILDDDDLDIFLPPLPLAIALQDYIRKIIDKARSIAKSKSEVDRLLKQKNGAERQRLYQEKNR